MSECHMQPAVYIIMSELRSSSFLHVPSKRLTRFSESGTKLSSFLDRRQLKLGDEVKNSELRFKYKPGELYNFINRDLKLRNQSEGYIIRFTIQCNNPLHYRVHPWTGEIYPGKTIEIMIQINGMEEVSQIGRSFFAKFASDRFQISWYSYREESKQIEEHLSKMKKQETSQTLTVFVDYDEEKKEELEEEPKKNHEDIKNEVEETLNANRKELARLENLITKLEKKPVNDQWINTKFLVFLGCLAFIAGAMIPF